MHTSCTQHAHLTHTARTLNAQGSMFRIRVFSLTSDPSSLHSPCTGQNRGLRCLASSKREDAPCSLSSPKALDLRERILKCRLPRGIFALVTAAHLLTQGRDL